MKNVDLLYIVYGDLSKSSFLGIKKKFFEQITCLKQMLSFDEVGLISLYGNKIIETHFKINNNKTDIFIGNIHGSRIKKRALFFKTLYSYVTESSPKVIYIRYPGIDWFFSSFLRKVKKALPKSVVVMEFPSYPYKKEAFKRGIGSTLLYYSEKLFFSYVIKNLDLVIIIGNVENKFKRDLIAISNAISLGNIKIVPLDNINPDTVVLIGVANISFWHGYDRVIKGLKEYKGNSNVIFHIIGEGNEKNKLINLVKNLDLKDKVIFHNAKSGKELDKIFKISNIGIGALGGYRLGLKYQMSLKAREYAARGIPFVLSTYDPDFPPFLDFVKYVPNDDSAINIQEIITWYKDLLSKYEYNLPNIIRKYAEEHLTWGIKLKPVAEKIKELLKQKGVNT